MEYKKVVTERATTNDLIKLTDGDNAWLLKRYQGKEAGKHRDNEQRRLALWAKKGYLVPEVIDLILPKEQTPYLIIQWLNGCSLTEFLISVDFSIEIKMQKIEELIRLFYLRQQYCQVENNYDFIHHDPNTGNIIVVDNDFYYIDFESQVSAESYGLIEALAIELAKFIRWAARDIGIEQLDKIIKLTIEIYGAESPVLAQLIKRVHNRNFQFVHRWKNRNKKNKNPEDVTKYDLADRFQFFLSSASS